MLWKHWCRNFTAEEHVFYMQSRCYADNNWQNFADNRDLFYINGMRTNR